MAAFPLSQQSWGAVTDIRWPPKPKIFAIGRFAEEAGQSYTSSIIQATEQVPKWTPDQIKKCFHLCMQLATIGSGGILNA